MICWDNFPAKRYVGCPKFILLMLSMWICMGGVAFAQAVSPPKNATTPKASTVLKSTATPKDSTVPKSTAAPKASTVPKSTATPKASTVPKTDVQQPDSIFFLSYWGPVSSGRAPVAQIAAIAPAALLVKDNKGLVFQVASFRINYKFKSTYRDDESGNVKTMSDLRVSDFSGTGQLPDYWAASIKDNIKPGDEIIFNKILFKNKSGKLQMAPELRITVQ